jgi:PAS domain S-box-containing protein
MKGIRTGMLAAPRRTWPIVVAAAGVLALQVALASASIELLSAVRAYVGGESLYSKGRRSAQMALRDYLSSKEEADFDRFSAALSVPIGDGLAREALEQSPVDVAAARRGFLAGGNDAKDVDGLIWLFRWFHKTQLLGPSVALWREGDAGVQELSALGRAAHERIRAGASEQTVAQLRDRARDIDTRLTRLEDAFSFRLATTSREAGVLLLTLNLGSAAVLGAILVAFTRLRLQERAAAEREIARLLDAVGDAVICVDGQRRIVLFNRAAEAIFGSPSRERLGTPVADLVTARDYPRLEALIDEAVPADDVETLTLRIHDLRARRADGTSFPAEVSTSAVRTRIGPVATIVLRDVSDQERARAEREARLALEAANQAKSGFLSNMSHELRTPLNAVIGFARLMAMDETSGLREEDRKRVEHIEHAGRHLLALVNELLDLSLIEAGQMTMSLEPVDVAAEAERALIMTAQAAMGARVRLSPLARVDDLPEPKGCPHGPARSHFVMADRVRLQQVLINLLSNAVKYTPAGGQVDLSLRAREDFVDIVVEDTGKGMTPEQQAQLFEPFNRLGAEHSKVEGTGIGLVLTRQFVALMKGSLRIESASGVGTRVTVSLPSTAPPSMVPPEGPSELPTESRSSELLDLIYAEDNEVNVELMRQILALRSGVALRVATTGAEALAMARSRPPQLMLVDMHLGDMTGMELAARLRSSSDTASIALIAVSADALPDQIDQALSAGFDDYVTKPVNPARLVQVIAEQQARLASGGQAASPSGLTAPR